MKVAQFKFTVLIYIFTMTTLAACQKNEQADLIKEYIYTGIQVGHFDSKTKNMNQQFQYRIWDSAYQDQMKVRINITRKLITFIFNKSTHVASPDTTSFVTTIQHNNYSIPLGYRVRYDFRFENDSLFAEYFNLDGLTDTFYVNKRLRFSGRRLQ